MTSAPTACPECGRLPDFCDHREIVATQLAEPRQPDTSAERDAERDAEAEILGYHGCASGDCPHEKQSECFAALVEAGHDAGHARALKEMSAKLESAEEGERFYRREWESACERVDCAQEQLAAAELKAGEYEKALELIERAYATHGERMAHQDYAAKVLAKHRRGGEGG